MTDFETDYLVIGAGAVGMAFTDTLLDEDPDCHITIVDKHAKPGGHWNDAYSFVTLHQPSSTYGVNSMELCTKRVDQHGHNTGMYPLAKHAEILAYYEQLMNDRFLPSGRVKYLPLTEYREGHVVKGILSGEEQTIGVRRKLVDGTYFQTSVPSTHKPGYEIGEGTPFAIPGDLPALWKDIDNLPEHFVIVGAGKTAMDTGVWLLEAGVPADRIGWVRPRESWLFNRKYLQPAEHHLDRLIEFQLGQMRAAAASESGDEMFAKLGEQGLMLRIDPETKPEMFHFAVISEAEVELLRGIKSVYRQGRVKRIDPGKMHFADEVVDVPKGTLFIDCTASAVPFDARGNQRPFFDGDTITLQLAQSPFVPYSAALAAFLEANFETDDEKNALIPPAPLTDTPSTYPAAFFANLRSTGLLAANEKVSAWNSKSRLHPTGPAIAKLSAEKSPMLAALSEVGPTVKECMPGIMKLGMAAYAEHNASLA
ncbi:MAG: NAD(P)-binding protein [Pseudomonadota bacterium]